MNTACRLGAALILAILRFEGLMKKCWTLFDWMLTVSTVPLLKGLSDRREFDTLART